MNQQTASKVNLEELTGRQIGQLIARLSQLEGR